jgi:hypothetical protein
MTDTDLASRVEALEQALELTYRPILDLVPPERIHAVERSAYEAHIRIAELEARIAALEAAAPIATEAHKMVTSMLHSRTWQALVSASDFLLRLTGRGGHRGS